MVPRPRIRNRLRLLTRLALAAGLVSGVLVVAAAGPAGAVACSSPVRYAASSNTIYLVTAQTFTLTDIVAGCPSAPLTLVDPVSRTWELAADLVLQNGSGLLLRGGPGGDVDTLRIRSLADNQAGHVQQIMAYYGTVTIDHTRVTSWDDAAGAADDDPALPSNAGSTDRGRAFIRALSYLDTDGVTPRESALVISDSELDHLGYYGAEAYGVAYKTRGCDHTNQSVCRKVGVYGSQTRSRFHHNFMGTYTWGAKNIPFTDNEYDHNVMYGLDPHDVSINLTIDHNHFHDNGDHGVICSQACDNLTITDNESDHNGMEPFLGPTGDADTPGQVHGIMIHRGVTNTVIAGNYVHDQPNGAGIAVFDSAGNTITNNTVVGAEYGLRVSVGSAGNTFSHNTVTNSLQYAVFLYKGSDLPSYTTMSGRPTANIFDDNTYNGTGSNAVKLTESDQNVFSNSSFANLGGSLLFNLSAGNVLRNLTLPGNQRISVTGSAAVPGSLVLTSPPAPVSVSVDSNSSADVTSPTGQLWSIRGLPTTVGATGSTLHLTSTLLGGTNGVTLTPQKVTVRPASGTALATATGTGAGTQVTLSGAATGVALAFGIGGLTPNTGYQVTRNGTVVGTGVSNGAGLLSFTDTAPGGALGYALAVA